jgi:hypothetical protein
VDEYKLSPSIFKELKQKWGPFSVDMFASDLNHQLPKYISHDLMDKNAVAVDAMREE